MPSRPCCAKWPCLDRTRSWPQPARPPKPFPPVSHLEQAPAAAQTFQRGQSDANPPKAWESRLPAALVRGLHTVSLPRLLSKSFNPSGSLSGSFEDLLNWTASRCQRTCVEAEIPIFPGTPVQIASAAAASSCLQLRGPGTEGIQWPLIRCQLWAEGRSLYPAPSRKVPVGPFSPQKIPSLHPALSELITDCCLMT